MDELDFYDEDLFGDEDIDEEMTIEDIDDTLTEIQYMLLGVIRDRDGEEVKVHTTTKAREILLGIIDDLLDQRLDLMQDFQNDTEQE